MQEALAPFIPFVIFLFIGIIISILRDRSCREIKDLLIKKLKRNKTKTVYLDTKSTWKVTSFLGFHIRWDKVEVIIIKDSIFYLSYFSLFGYRVYSLIKHLQLNNSKFTLKEITEIIPIKDTNIKNGNLIITPLIESTIKKVTITIKDVISSGQFEVIKKMLQIRYKN